MIYAEAMFLSVDHTGIVFVFVEWSLVARDLDGIATKTFRRLFYSMIKPMDGTVYCYGNTVSTLL